MMPKFWTSWGTFAANTVVALTCMAVSLFVKIEVTDALKHYLPKEEFVTYKREHAETINARFDKIEVNQEKNAEKLVGIMGDIRQLLVEVRIMSVKLDRAEKLGASVTGETNRIN